VTKPRVSIILPSYNHEAYIAAAVKSVLSQSLSDLELILIDDASPDGSWGVLESIDDDRLRLSRNERNQGAHNTLIDGLAQARGEYLAILNSDDLYDQFRLEKMIKCMQSEDARMAISDVIYIDGYGNLLHDNPRCSDYRALRQWCLSHTPSTWFLAGNLAVTTSNLLFHRSILEDMSPIPPLRYTHDWAMALNISAQSKVLWVKEGLLSYRVHSGNTLSEPDRWKHIHENAFILVMGLNRLQEIRRVQCSQEKTQSLEVLEAILRNPSAPPLTTLCLLALAMKGASENDLVSSFTVNNESYLAPFLAERTGLPEALFESTAELQHLAHTVHHQAAMLEERWQAMQEMEGMLKERTQAMQEMEGMLEERWQAMQEMEGMLKERTQAMKEMQLRIEETECLSLAPLISLEKKVRRKLRGFRP
jgi:glycosyltransferase involved in cell wall biosynthesis